MIAKDLQVIWSSIYNKSFLIENNIKFNETSDASYQDNGFFAQIYFLATLINHRVNIDKSVSNSLYKNNTNFILALKELYDNLMKRDLYKYYKNSFEKYVIEFSKWHYNKNRYYNNKKNIEVELKNFLKYIGKKENTQTIIDDIVIDSKQCNYLSMGNLIAIQVVLYILLFVLIFYKTKNKRI